MCYSSCSFRVLFLIFRCVIYPFYFLSLLCLSSFLLLSGRLLSFLLYIRALFFIHFFYYTFPTFVYQRFCLLVYFIVRPFLNLVFCVDYRLFLLSTSLILLVFHVDYRLFFVYSSLTLFLVPPSFSPLHSLLRFTFLLDLSRSSSHFLCSFRGMFLVFSWDVLGGFGFVHLFIIIIFNTCGIFLCVCLFIYFFISPRQRKRKNEEKNEKEEKNEGGRK